MSVFGVRVLCETMWGGWENDKKKSGFFKRYSESDPKQCFSGSFKWKAASFHENDLAEVLRELSTAERSRLYRILESSMLADVFEYLEEEETVQYLEEMDVKKRQPFFPKWKPMPWQMF